MFIVVVTAVIGSAFIYLGIVVLNGTYKKWYLGPRIFPPQAIVYATIPIGVGFLELTIILLLSSINFVNLQTANATTRIREIGIKKTVGFSKKRLWYQFIFESLFITRNRHPFQPKRFPDWNLGCYAIRVNPSFLDQVWQSIFLMNLTRIILPVYFAHFLC